MNHHTQHLHMVPHLVHTHLVMPGLVTHTLHHLTVQTLMVHLDTVMIPMDQTHTHQEDMVMTTKRLLPRLKLQVYH